MTKIEIDVEDYIELLNERREFVKEHYNWTMPDCLWEYFCDVIRECGIGNNSNPSYVVDNAILNGDWGSFDNYKHRDETDKEFIKRVENDVFYLNPDERIVCFCL